MAPRPHPRTLDDLTPRQRQAVDRWFSEDDPPELSWPMLAALARSTADSPRFAEDPVIPRLLHALADRTEAMAKGRNMEKTRRHQTVARIALDRHRAANEPEEDNDGP